MDLNISLIFEVSEKQTPPLSLEIRQNVLAEDDIKLGPVQDFRDKLEEMDRPWLFPGVDIKDYFNYGLNEQTFIMHQEKMRILRIFTEFINRQKDDNQNKRVKFDLNRHNDSTGFNRKTTFIYDRNYGRVDNRNNNLSFNRNQNSSYNRNQNSSYNSRNFNSSFNINQDRAFNRNTPSSLNQKPVSSFNRNSDSSYNSNQEPPYTSNPVSSYNKNQSSSFNRNAESSFNRNSVSSFNKYPVSSNNQNINISYNNSGRFPQNGNAPYIQKTNTAYSQNGNYRGQLTSKSMDTRLGNTLNTETYNRPYNKDRNYNSFNTKTPVSTGLSHSQPYQKSETKHSNESGENSKYSSRSNNALSGGQYGSPHLNDTTASLDRSHSYSNNTLRPRNDSHAFVNKSASDYKKKTKKII
ncbi:hypothetical protein CDIK_2826 [Cucumispora dikerogammari]|nr:hypothetical protein CDIK_2826 [Cucumispora dikerogammari]